MPSRRPRNPRSLRGVGAYRRGLCALHRPLCSLGTKWLLSYKQPFVEEDTYKLTYVSLVEGHLIPYFGNALLSDIRPVDIQAYFATKTACSESRLKKMRSILNAIFECAIENDLCYKNPAKRCTYRSTAQKHLEHVLSDRSRWKRSKPIPQIVCPRSCSCWKPACAVVNWSGLMWSEDPPLNEEDTPRAALYDRAERDGRCPDPPKWKSYRTLPLSEEAVPARSCSLPKESLYLFPNEEWQARSPEHMVAEAQTPYAKAAPSITKCRL